ncbi:MAG: hypothetical protein MZV63_60045 [Marinilabiliales bacterium]|nr:hypothetical protein [Marinilabiliales bacterium]
MLEDCCSARPFRSDQGGDIAKRTGRIASIMVGEGLLGRVINTTGKPLDRKRLD